MMHYKDIVVSICDSNKKALREYDSQRLENGRETKVHIPFETEYQILVKNNQTKNIRLDIDIDGTNVTNDGLIIRPWTTAFIERFLNSENKFKFVPVSHEGVSDPTSKENGIITVNAYFEKQIPKPVMVSPSFPHIFWNNTPLAGGSGDWNPPVTHTSYGISGPPTYGSSSSSSSGGSSSSSSVNYCCDNIKCLNSPGVSAREVDYSMTVTSASVGQAGATIEGGRSNQTFCEAHWEGDDPLFQAVTFKFKLLGMSNTQSKEWQEYMRLKQKFNAA
jgi:hypothetical protein